MSIIKIIVKNIVPVSKQNLIRKILFRLKSILSIRKVRIESTTICQLNCKSCYMRVHNYGTMGIGYLKFVDFKNFVQSNKFIKRIELSNSGEMFLNPDLISIIEYAYNHGINLYADNGVNFNTASDDIIEALVKYRFRSITVSLDGASQASYSVYRINGNFDKVIDNIKKLNYYKQKYKSPFPHVLWQYIIMEHNEDDVSVAKKIAAELDIPISFKLTWDEGYVPKNPDMLKRETGLTHLTREDVLNNSNQIYNYSICYQLWTDPQINWDGRLLGCCTVFADDFGVNVFEVGLEKALNSKNYIYAKKMLKGKVAAPDNSDNIPCANCDNYKQMLKTGQYL